MIRVCKIKINNRIKKKRETAAGNFFGGKQQSRNG